jgi:MFS superfamily sulfate permease-like transporter
VRRPPPIAAALSGLALAGVALGIVGSFLHLARVELLGIRWPVGLVVLLMATLGAWWLSGRAVNRRAGVAASYAGWLVAVLVLAVPRAEGDAVFPNSPLSLIYLFAGVLGGGILLGAWTARPPADEAAASAQPSSAVPG